MWTRYNAVLGLLYCLIFTAGCYTSYAVPTRIPVTFDNVGSACFNAHGTLGLRIYVESQHPDSCMSSSCTVILEENHEFVIDQENRAIQLSWHVVAQEQNVVDGVMRGCTADCRAPENWSMQTESLIEGEYTIWIGDNLVGTLQIPLQEPSICFDSYVNFQRPSASQEASPLATSTP